MTGVRYRKASDDGRNLKSTYVYPRKKKMSFLRLFKLLFYSFLFCCGLLFIAVIFHNSGPFKNTNHQTNFIDHISTSVGLNEKVYAVVIDAGSTGSRVLAFTFLQNIFSKSLKLVDELWHEVKPGLSSYKDDPLKGAHSLIPLLDLAKTRIPEENWPSTPLVLKATAGLRLLPTEIADNLLNQVKEVLNKSKFKISEDSVGIMDGKDEGIFSWFTVNYLSDLIQGKPESTLVALDLGGGSTQITFLPTIKDTLKHITKDHLWPVTLFRQSYELFTRSYLGLGLMAGRASVIKSHGQPKGVIRSPCFNPIVDTTWPYNGETYHIKGPENPQYIDQPGKMGRLPTKIPIADFDKCFKTCVDVIKSQVVEKLDEIHQREVVAFSYFFDRAVENGLIDPFEGGTIHVEQFFKTAKDVCQTANVDQPFACLDLTFISAFLQHGYGFSNKTHIKLYKKIKGSEVSWALGLAIHMLNNGL